MSKPPIYPYGSPTTVPIDLIDLPRLPGVAGIVNEDADLAALTEHMRVHGMADPLVTTSDPASGMLIILDGCSRFLAAGRLGWKEINVINLPIPTVLEAAAQAVENPTYPDLVTPKRLSHKLRLGIVLGQLWAPWMEIRRSQVAAKGGHGRLGRKAGDPIKSRNARSVVDSQAALLRLRILGDIKRTSWSRLYQLRGAYLPDLEPMTRNGIIYVHDSKLALTTLARIDAGEGFNRLIEDYLLELNPGYSPRSHRRERQARNAAGDVVIGASQWRRQMQPTINSITQLIESANNLGAPHEEIEREELEHLLHLTREADLSLRAIMKRLRICASTRLDNEE